MKGNCAANAMHQQVTLFTLWKYFQNTRGYIFSYVLEGLFIKPSINVVSTFDALMFL